jgi:hypothetical protein
MISGVGEVAIVGLENLKDAKKHSEQQGTASNNAQTFMHASVTTPLFRPKNLCNLYYHREQLLRLLSGASNHCEVLETAFPIYLVALFGIIQVNWARSPNVLLAIG